MDLDKLLGFMGKKKVLILKYRLLDYLILINELEENHAVSYLMVDTTLELSIQLLKDQFSIVLVDIGYFNDHKNEIQSLILKFVQVPFVLFYTTGYWDSSKIEILNPLIYYLQPFNELQI